MVCEIMCLCSVSSSSARGECNTVCCIFRTISAAVQKSVAHLDFIRLCVEDFKLGLKM